MTVKCSNNSTISVLFRSSRGMKLMLAFCVFIIVVGCNKYKLSSDHEVIGDFEWGYSSNDSFESTSQDNYVHRYGIRIKDNSKVYVFKNDEIIYKGKIEEIIPQSSEKYWIKVFDNNGYIVDDGYTFFQYESGLIISENWPLHNYDNYYFRK